MCYDITSGLKALIKYSKHRQDDPKYIEALEKKLELWIKEIKAHHYVSGFDHPKVLVFTSDLPFEPQAFVWGLIPSWIKDKKSAKILWNQTLNARIETIFEKPSFKNSAINKRCIIYIDSFFEHHHANGKTYPFHISSKDGSPLAIAGLWDEWVDKESGEIIKSATMVTTKANTTMSKIHNNPKLEEPRMPVILNKENQNEWLAPYTNEADKEKLIKICAPYPDELLKYYTVKHLKGKVGVGDTPEVETEFNYSELKF